MTDVETLKPLADSLDNYARQIHSIAEIIRHSVVDVAPVRDCRFDKPRGALSTDFGPPKGRSTSNRMEAGKTRTT
jgi:hypothetical protein